MQHQKLTKIIATLGPASSSKEVVQDMIKEGINVIRLNASHFKDGNAIKVLVQMVRKVSKKMDVPIGIFLDLQGPKIRIGEFKNGSVVVENGDSFDFHADSNKLGDQHGVSLCYPELIQDFQIEDPVFINDGRVRLMVVEKFEKHVKCVVVHGGEISNYKGINLPKTQTSLSVLTDRDRSHIEIAVKLKIDNVALSFVSHERDVIGLRHYLNELGGNDIGIIAKIERSSAVDNIDEIINVSDLIMVARGDLGVEIGVEYVPEVQKSIIRKASKMIKPVIVATQMLESMVTERIATRAEVSDVANAIYDGCDAVMLSGETAVGIDPANAVGAMQTICIATDQHRTRLKKLKYSQVKRVFNKKTMATSFCKAADQIADENNADAILAFTSSGNTPLIASKLNPAMVILAPTDDEHVLRKMTFFRGVIPLMIEKPFNVIKSWTAMIDLSVADCLKRALLKKGDKLVITAGIPIGQPGGTNSIRMMEV